MKDLSLALHAIGARKLVSLLSVLLTAFGFMTAFIVLQTGAAIEARIARDSRVADIVIGAKGSPLQLVLSTVYHADIPTGNILYADAQKWMTHPQVRTAIPLALGDNWHGRRIVGTTRDYANAYGAALSAGDWWQKEFEAVAGAETGLAIGQTFAGAHGLAEGGHHHDDHLYTVTGILKPTHSILDRLILTSVESVLALHGQHHHHHDDGDEDEDDDVGDEHAHNDHEEHADAHEHTEHEAGHHGDEDEDHDEDEEHVHAPAEITALLVKARGPIAALNLPRSINRESALQAVSPALEMARLRGVFGIGSTSMAIMAGLLVGLAALSIFAGVAGSLDSRASDLAVLRALGYTRARLFGVIIAEGMMVTLGGLALGIACGIAAYSAIAARIDVLGGAPVLTLSPALAALCLAVLGAGFAASLIPALRASQSDPARLLTQRE